MEFPLRMPDAWLPSQLRNNHLRFFKCHAVRKKAVPEERLRVRSERHTGTRIWPQTTPAPAACRPAATMTMVEQGGLRFGRIASMQYIRFSTALFDAMPNAPVFCARRGAGSPRRYWTSSGPGPKEMSHLEGS